MILQCQLLQISEAREISGASGTIPLSLPNQPPSSQRFYQFMQKTYGLHCCVTEQRRILGDFPLLFYKLGPHIMFQSRIRQYGSIYEFRQFQGRSFRPTAISGRGRGRSVSDSCGPVAQ